MVSQVNLSQVVHAGIDAFEIFSLYTKHFALMGADGNEESLVALLSKLAYGNVFSDVDTGFEFNSHVADNLDLGLDDVTGQPVGRNPHAQHTAKHWQLFEHRNLIPFYG